MTTIEISQFVKEQGFTQVAKATRKNVNQYGYVTFINAANEATNIYFSKSLDSEVPEGTLLNKEFFSNKTIVLAENAEKEARYKICHKDSQRISIEDLF